jgi:hypothetical protein
MRGQIGWKLRLPIFRQTHHHILRLQIRLRNPKNQISYASLVQNTFTAVAISSKWNSITFSGIKLTVLEQAHQSKTQ